jgi:hypothetical protein
MSSRGLAVHDAGGAGAAIAAIRREADAEGIPPVNILNQLDRLRAECAVQGRFLEAQHCVDEMRLLAAHQGERTVRELERQSTTDGAKELLREQQRGQVLQFTTLWEERLQDFEGKAEDAIARLKGRHQREYDEREDILREALANQRPHFSNKVVHGRREVARLVAGEQYAIAHRAQAVLEELEAGEAQRFEEMLSTKFARQTKKLKQQCATEVAALKQRVGGERDQLSAQRRENFQTLLTRHMNEATAAQQRARLLLNKKRRVLEKKINSMSVGAAAAMVPVSLTDVEDVM